MAEAQLWGRHACSWADMGPAWPLQHLAGDTCRCTSHGTWTCLDPENKAWSKGEAREQELCVAWPWQVNTGKQGTEALRQAGCLGSALTPPYLPFRDHVFSFDLQAQEEGEGLVPNKVRGCMRGGAGRETKLGKVYWGSRLRRSRDVRRGPGCPMTSPRFLSSVSDMEEPGCGELCCSGKAHGEEWGGLEGRQGGSETRELGGG